MVVDEQLWSDAGIIDYTNNIKLFMEVEFGKATQLQLKSISLSGNSKFKNMNGGRFCNST
jgi:hypothetical protein